MSLPTGVVLTTDARTKYCNQLVPSQQARAFSDDNRRMPGEEIDSLLPAPAPLKRTSLYSVELHERGG